MSNMDEFSDSLFFVGKFNSSALRDIEYTHLLIVMGDGKPSEEFRRVYPTIKTITFDVCGKRYEYDAERFFALLDWWKEYGHVLMDERMEEDK